MAGYEAGREGRGGEEEDGGGCGGGEVSEGGGRSWTEDDIGRGGLWGGEEEEEGGGVWRFLGVVGWEAPVNCRVIVIVVVTCIASSASPR